MKRIIALVMICICLFSLSGCQIKKRKPFMLDGPGMEFIPPWRAFTVSMTSSVANDHFYFKVSDDYDKITVIGSCMDSEGNRYETEEPIEIPYECLQKLWQLELEDLENATNEPPGIDGEETMILDDTVVTLTVVTDQGEYNKRASATLAKQIYNILLPYFENLK